MSKETLEYLIEYMKSVSPELWEYALGAIHAEAIQYMIGASCLLLVVVLLWFFEIKHGDDGFGYLLSLIPLGLFLFCLACGIARLISPEMYAIRMLVHFQFQ